MELSFNVNYYIVSFIPKNQSLSVIFIFKVNLEGNNPKLKIK
jgi:hypothetical protein